jgi:hypothetical protein
VTSPSALARGVGIAVLVVGALGSSVLAISQAFGSRPHRTGGRAALKCGEFRWPVKTLSDRTQPVGASSVNFTPTRTSVARLVDNDRKPYEQTQPTGKIGPGTPRLSGVETTTYRISATLIEARYVGKPREDRDIHLVIANRRTTPRVTMIVEFPDVACSGAASSIKKTQIRDARRAFEHQCGLPPKSRFADLHGKATITGVGFFDKIHGSTHGQAKPSGIELHPVLGFQLSTNTCG